MAKWFPEIYGEDEAPSKIIARLRAALKDAKERAERAEAALAKEHHGI
jgi:hypothetical protein